MKPASDSLFAVGAGLFVIIGLAWALYRPRVQQSTRYQATVVPLANIMDVGFIVLSPAIVLLAGFAAPLVMLGICLVAIATGFAISYNIRHQEPLEGTKDSVNRIARFSEWALLAASVVNISYYTLLLITLVLWPLGAYSEGALAVWGTVYLVAIMLIGWFGGMGWLNKKADQTTAFNIAAVIGVVVAFLFYNIQEWLGGRWEISTEVSITTEDFRKIIGLFAMVQGFEAARYIGNRFGAEQRISSMRLAQYISTFVFVVLVASILVIFLPPVVETGGTAIFSASDLVGETLPWIVLLAAIGSQTSAILGATSSRSDMIVNTGRVARKWTFPMLLIPTIALFLLTDVTQAVALASRVFAFYFLLQALIAGMLAWRKQAWGAVAGFVVVGLAMATISIFGISI